MNIRSLHDDDKQDEQKKQATDSFAGGEKSGLAIENPSDNPWPHAIGSGPAPPGARKVTIYKNGFKLDGKFNSLEDPENVKFLDEVKQGYAPKILRDGASGPVHLVLEDLRSEVYEPPQPPKYTLFSGEGQRLSNHATSSETSRPVDTTRGTIRVCESKPTTTIQFRFHDGSRITQPFNMTHTIADIHDFVMQCAPVDSAYSLLAGFPPKPISSDPSLTLEAAGTT